jgi:hypothetical protein
MDKTLLGGSTRPLLIGREAGGGLERGGIIAHLPRLGSVPDPNPGCAEHEALDNGITFDT